MDIDQRLRIQAAALEAAANAIVITDRDGVILWVNPAFTALTGYPAEEAVGKTPRILNSGQQERAFYEAMWTTILAGRVWHSELVNRRRDGSLFTESQTITPVRDGTGAITHFIAIKLDVTDRKRTDAELQRQREALYQNEKLAAMGQLLAGVAHELNNPLAVLVGQAYLLREQLHEGPLARRTTHIGQAAERCARIVKNFLALARQYPAERQEVALDQVVREGVELLAYPLRVDNVDVVLDLADLPHLWADAHQLQQVVVNLVANAHQAMREVPRSRRRLTVATRPSPGGARVRVEVADSGPGIPPDIRHRLFDPFFTTKPPGQGTGLGLSLCLGIVENHGGTMGVESQLGQGARFWVELPVGTPPASMLDREAAGSVPPPITGKVILVVDDEPEVAGLLKEILDVDDHHVDRVANGLAALDVLAQREYDLILSDIRMPELDGPGLYRELQRCRPQAVRRFVFVTGDVLNPETRALIEQTGVPVLHKPFTPEEVRHIVRRVLWEP